MDVFELVKRLDDYEFDYFYHETGTGEIILEEGLLVDGTNIIDTDNISFTKALVNEESI